ncbi:alpha/beta hydrolase [Bifidobacterium oedipodis]|uniref:Alpha/beta hydrolase n=1 Tax=Bifidobacterium oedipodis TaxID=2675322 RepID=A0A7Y0EQ44_9BIFI|nr:alpha/beta hydrolase [Bifidobacterium sp. DSM 109957]NMM94379.1 alpha/beta hydrolase [Bifidobacterium sp. DSM 109957]
MSRRVSAFAKVSIAAAALTAAAASCTAIAANLLCTYAVDTKAKRSTFNTPWDSLPQHLVHDAELQAEAAAWFKNSRQPVTLRSRDGLSLHGWLLDPDCAQPDAHRYAICCHGYTGEPAEMAKWAYHFARMGFTVLLPAHRGHERSEGRYVGMGFLEHYDLLDWISLIIDADPQARILLHGNSMGAATVMMTAGDPALPRNVVAAISDCGYASVVGQFTNSIVSMTHLPRPVAYGIVKLASTICHRKAGYRFEEASCVDALRHATIPMLFIHGSEDSFVKPHDLELNYRACASIDRDKLLIPGAEHTMSASTDPVRYWNRVDALIQRAFEA